MMSKFKKRKLSLRAFASLCGGLAKGTNAHLSQNEPVSRRWRPTSVRVIPSLRAAAPLVSRRNNCPFFGKTNMRFQAAGSNFRICHSERSRGIWPTIVRVFTVQGQIPPLRDAAHHSGRNDSTARCCILRGALNPISCAASRLVYGRKTPDMSLRGSATTAAISILAPEEWHIFSGG